MSHPQGAPQSGSVASPARLEAFSDGVFAIAATLLILDVREGSGPLGTSLLHIWPSYVAYGVSFLTIGIIWINHHTVCRQVGQVDRLFLLINVVFLMLVAFIPFPTRLIAAHLRESDLKPAALSYGIVLTLTAMFFNALWFYAAHNQRLLVADADARTISGISRSYRPGPWLYLAGTLIALVSPVASVSFFAAIALFYVIESSLFGRQSEAT
jgi:uncharacterized membrane protein